MKFAITLLWILLSIFQSVVRSSSTVSFSSPTSGALLPANVNVLVTVSYGTSANQNIDVLMSCATNPNTAYRVTKIAPSVTIPIKTGYVGPCNVTGTGSIAPVYFSIAKLLTINSPSTTSPLTSYLAGGLIPVSWTYTPSASSSTTATVDCSLSGSGSTTTTPTTSRSTNVNLPPSMYGSNCSLTLTSTDTTYTLFSPTFLIVSQQLAFVSPASGSTISISTGSITVFLSSSPGPTPFSVPVNLQCGADVTTTSVNTNAEFLYSIPPSSAYSGPCTLTAVPSASQTFLVAPAALPIFLKYSLTFSSITSNPSPGGAFSYTMTSNTTTATAPVNVNLVCGGATVQTWTSVPVNQAYSTTLSSSVTPGASCTLQTPAASTYYIQSTSPSFSIAPGITITSPSAGSSVASGTTLNIAWYRTGGSGTTTYTASLACTGFTTLNSTTTGLSTSINILSSYFGSSCTVSVSSPGYTTAQVSITVTQTVSFSTPLNGTTLNLISASIPVKLVTSGGSGNVAITTTLLCSGASTSNNIAVNTDSLTVPVTSAQIGSCTLTLSGAPNYLILPSPAFITITLKYTISFTTTPGTIYRGQSFTIQISTQTAAASAPSVTLNLICPTGVTSATWTSVLTNQANSLLLPSDVPVATCYFQVSSGATYSSATSSNVNVLAPTITITNPVAGSSNAAGSTVAVAWTATGSTAGVTFTAALACAGFPDATSSNTSLSTNIDIPSTYYGSSCTVSVSATGYVTPQVSITVTQTVSFSTPLSGDVIALTSSSIPVELITNGGTGNANVTSTFQCTSSSGTIYTSGIAVNTDGLTIPVTSSQIGSCTLALTSAPSYLILPSPAFVTFTLKYALSFTSLPTTIYRGQDFTIQIDTASAAASPPTVTLNLICPTDVVNGTWTNVLINQPNTLTLSSTTVLDSCYFKVNNDSTYTQAVSSNVQVSKVPVTIAQPNSQTQYSKSSNVPLQITTTVSPVSGTVNLIFTCTSMTTPYPVTIAINVVGSFSYPSAAYGACRLGISLDDPIFA